MKETKGRLVKAVEGFLKLRTSIFPEVRGAIECAALHELEDALREAGGKVPYEDPARALKRFIKHGMKLEQEGLDPGPIGNPKRHHAR
jgi:hypothetical protein